MAKRCTPTLLLLFSAMMVMQLVQLLNVEAFSSSALSSSYISTCTEGDDDDCPSDYCCAHGGGGASDGSSFGTVGESDDDALYPYVCCDCDNKFTVTDEWCEEYVADGQRAKYEAQCQSEYGSTNDDGSYTCRAIGIEGAACYDGEDGGCGDDLYCAHGAGGADGSPIGGDPDETDDILYPYVCCAEKWTVTHEWCEGVAPAGALAKYEAQCESKHGERNNGAGGAYVCASLAAEGEPCEGGDDDLCDGDLYCAHGGGGGADGPLGGDPDASDDVLYPHVCCADKWTVTDEWCEGFVLNARAKYVAQCTEPDEGSYTENDDGSYMCHGPTPRPSGRPSATPSVALTAQPTRMPTVPTRAPTSSFAPPTASPTAKIELNHGIGSVVGATVSFLIVVGGAWFIYTKDDGVAPAPRVPRVRGPTSAALADAADNGPRRTWDRRNVCFSLSFVAGVIQVWCAAAIAEAGACHLSNDAQSGFCGFSTFLSSTSFLGAAFFLAFKYHYDDAVKANLSKSNVQCLDRVELGFCATWSLMYFAGFAWAVAGWSSLNLDGNSGESASARRRLATNGTSTNGTSAPLTPTEPSPPLPENVRMGVQFSILFFFGSCITWCLSAWDALKYKHKGGAASLPCRRCANAGESDAPPTVEAGKALHWLSAAMGALMCWCASAIAGNVTDDSGAAYCYIGAGDLDSNACAFSTALAATSLLGAVLFAARKHVSRARFNARQHRALDACEFGFSVVWSFLHFFGFCFVANLWRKHDPVAPYPNDLSMGVELIIVCLFFGFFTWGASAAHAFSPAVRKQGRGILRMGVYLASLSMSVTILGYSTAIAANTDGEGSQCYLSNTLGEDAAYNVCMFSQFLGALASAAALLLVARAVLPRCRKHDDALDQVEFASASACAVLYFLGFCFLCQAWRTHVGSDDNEEEVPVPGGSDASLSRLQMRTRVETAIAFSFFCTLSWATSAGLAYEPVRGRLRSIFRTLVVAATMAIGVALLVFSSALISPMPEGRTLAPTTGPPTTAPPTTAAPTIVNASASNFSLGTGGAPSVLPSAEEDPETFCFLSNDLQSNACAYTQFTGATTLLVGLLFAVRSRIKWEQREHFELTVTIACACFNFIGFCYVSQAWRTFDLEELEEYPETLRGNAHAAIAFSFAAIVSACILFADTFFTMAESTADPFNAFHAFLRIAALAMGVTVLAAATALTGNMSDDSGAVYCYLSSDKRGNGCRYGQTVAAASVLAVLFFMARKAAASQHAETTAETEAAAKGQKQNRCRCLRRKYTSWGLCVTKHRDSLDKFEFGFGASITAAWFIGFCYLCDLWRTYDEPPVESSPPALDMNARLAITFSFFGVIVWFCLTAIVFVKELNGDHEPLGQAVYRTINHAVCAFLGAAVLGHAVALFGHSADGAETYCYFSEDRNSNACAYSSGLGSVSLLMALFFALRSKVPWFSRWAPALDVLEFGFSTACAFLQFIAFCFLCNTWRIYGYEIKAPAAPTLQPTSAPTETVSPTLSPTIALPLDSNRTSNHTAIGSEDTFEYPMMSSIDTAITFTFFGTISWTLAAAFTYKYGKVQDATRTVVCIQCYIGSFVAGFIALGFSLAITDEGACFLSNEKDSGLCHVNLALGAISSLAALAFGIRSGRRKPTEQNSTQVVPLVAQAAAPKAASRFRKKLTNAALDKAEVGFCSCWAFVHFVNFCAVSDHWRTYDPSEPYPVNLNTSVNSIIALSFVSMVTWTLSLVDAYGHNFRGKTTLAEIWSRENLTALAESAKEIIDAIVDFVSHEDHVRPELHFLSFVSGVVVLGCATSVTETFGTDDDHVTHCFLASADDAGRHFGCVFSQIMGTTSFLAALCLFARVRMKARSEAFTSFEEAISACFAILEFVAFCYVCDSWRKLEPSERADMPAPEHLTASVNAMICFTFVGIVSWAMLAMHKNTSRKISDMESAAKSLSDTFNRQSTLNYLASFTMGVIVLGCASGMQDNFSDTTGEQFCYLSENLDSAACSFTRWLGALSVAGALCWMLRDKDWRNRDRQQHDRLLDYAEIAFCAACALSHFAAFCFLCDEWRTYEPVEPYPERLFSSVQTTITFCFFSVGSWAAATMFAIRAKNRVATNDNEERVFTDSTDDVVSRFGGLTCMLYVVLVVSVSVNNLWAYDCPQGTFTLDSGNEPDGWGRSHCHSCPKGFYSGHAVGLAECKVCPGGSVCPRQMTAHEQVRRQAAAGIFAGFDASVSITGLAEGMFLPSMPVLCEKGRFCAGGTADARPCPFGTFAPAGSAACSPCAPGKFDESASRFSSIVISGDRSRIADHGVCTLCPTGFYQNVSGSVVCAACPFARFNPLNGSDNVDQGCTRCAEGKFGQVSGQSRESTACFSCYPGFFTSERGRSACKACAAGLFAHEAGRSKTCDACGRGEFSDSESTTCSACPLGKYNEEEGQAKCTGCPAGFYMSDLVLQRRLQAGPSRRRLCHPGGSSVRSCATCMSECGFCEGCSTSSPTAVPSIMPSASPTSPTAPTNVPTALPTTPTASPSSSPSTVPSASPSTSPSGSPSGSPTLVPSFSPTGTPTGATSQTYCDRECERGFYCPAASVTPTICEAGSYCDETGLRSAKACPAGKYSLTSGAMTEADCQAQCEEGLQHTGSSCDVCLAGKYCAKGATSAPEFVGKPGAVLVEACPAGHYCPQQSAAPILCDAGTINDQENSGNIQACNFCPTGWVCPFQNDTASVPCPAGTFNANTRRTNSTSCMPCAAGKFSTVAGRGSCNECPRGHYCNATAQIACPVGTFNAHTGSFSIGNCTKCPGGRYSSDPGATSDGCIVCEEGQFCLPGSSSTTNCHVGHYCPRESSAPILCDPGAVNTATGSVSVEACTLCEAGNRCPDQTQAAVPCPLGTIQHLPGQTNCTICPPGTYCPDSLAETPRPCPAGTFSLFSQQGALENCDTCPEGRFSAEGGRGTECQEARGGFFCAEGAIAETQCAISTYCPPGSGAATPCPPGRFGTFAGASSVDDCALCPSGRYNGDEGQLACIECDDGTLCVDELQTSFVGSVHQITCEDVGHCGRGRCNEEYGGDQCSACCSLNDDEMFYSHCTSSYYLRAGDCVECPTIPWGTILWTLTALVGGFVALVCIDISRWEKLAAIDQAISYNQNLVIVSLITTHWPVIYQIAWEYLSIFTNLLQLEGTGPECYLGTITWDTRFWVTVGMYLVLGILLLFSILRRQRTIKKREDKLRKEYASITAEAQNNDGKSTEKEGDPSLEDRMKEIATKIEKVVDDKWGDKLTRVAVLFTTIGYVQLTQLSFRSFQRGGKAPIPGQEEEEHVFLHDASIPFYSTEHQITMGLSGFVIAFVVIYVPIWIYRTTQGIANKKKLDDPKTKRRFGALYDAYSQRASSSGSSATADGSKKGKKLVAKARKEASKAAAKGEAFVCTWPRGVAPRYTCDLHARVKGLEKVKFGETVQADAGHLDGAWITVRDPIDQTETWLPVVTDGTIRFRPVAVVLKSLEQAKKDVTKHNKQERNRNQTPQFVCVDPSTNGVAYCNSKTSSDLCARTVVKPCQKGEVVKVKSVSNDGEWLQNEANDKWLPTIFNQKNMMCVAFEPYGGAAKQKLNLRVSFGAVSLIRRGLCASLVVSFSAYPLVQVGVQVGLSVLYLLLVWTLQPFEHADFSLLKIPLRNGYNKVEIYAALLHIVNQIYAFLLIFVGGDCPDTNDFTRQNVTGVCLSNDDCEAGSFCNEEKGNVCCEPLIWMDLTAYVIVGINITFFFLPVVILQSPFLN